MLISTAMKGNKNSYWTTAALKINEWTTIKIAQFRPELKNVAEKSEFSVRTFVEFKNIR